MRSAFSERRRSRLLPALLLGAAASGVFSALVTVLPGPAESRTRSRPSAVLAIR